jgi:DNA replicative helicase MCM subunit Mcm2 (Cdc46/Mcm family)
MKAVFTCPTDGYIEINKITDKQNIVRDKKCPTCKGPLTFIRKNKKKYKILKKQAV